MSEAHFFLSCRVYLPDTLAGDTTCFHTYICLGLVASLGLVFVGVLPAMALAGGFHIDTKASVSRL
jgi:hypothetical protein